MGQFLDTRHKTISSLFTSFAPTPPPPYSVRHSIASTPPPHVFEKVVSRTSSVSI
jgi:hypothetical protein